MDMMEDESSVSVAPMVDFWGVELTGKCKTVVWPSSDRMMDPDLLVRLELRQACLGAKAKSGERNVVELTAENENEEKVTHSIVSLTVGGTEQCPLLIEVYPPVKLYLASGNGPVHIVGNIQTELGNDLSSEEDEDEEEVHREVASSRKRSGDFPMSHEAKTRKTAKENGTNLDTFIEDSEEEEEEEEDSEEEESDENESSNDEDNQTPQKPSLVRKSKAKSAQKTLKTMSMKPMSKTPQPVKGSKTTGKMSFSAPNTPEQTKTSKKGGKCSLSIEDMKEKLKKTPNIPKKLDKFNNYVQQNFKVNDDKVKKQLWDFTQKIRSAK